MSSTLAEQWLESPPVIASVSTPRRYSSRWALVLFCSDVLMFILSSYAATQIVRHWEHGVAQPRIFITSAVFIGVWIIVFQLAGLYNRSFALSIKDEFYCTVAALTVGIIPELVLFTVLPSIATSRLMLIVALGLSIVAVGGTRVAAHALRDMAARRRPQRVTIVGERNRIDAALDSLNLASSDHVLKVEADVDSAVEIIGASDGPQFDNVPWFRAARQWNTGLLILTEVVHPDALPHLLETAKRHRMKLCFAPPRLRRQAFSLSFETSGHQALIVPYPLRACSEPARLVKRMFDLAFASLMMIIFGPIMLVVAGLILLTDGGPVLYRQERVALGGGIFKIFKFRSMPTTSENETGPIWTQHGDKRATKLGAFLRRTSLDELPQIFNVLRGEMSIVGPRPERPVFVELFRGYLPRYDERHLVSPGITGWSHVQMKRGAPISDIGERLSHDLYYIENYSFLMDISIILKTAAEFLFQKAV